MKRYYTFSQFVAFVILVTVAGSAPAQDSEPIFPTDPASWVNSPPLSGEMLKGKAAFLWFYEEGCPRCREKWPELLATAAKFQGQPIVFIGVNSGNARTIVAAYARQNRVNWPIIVDSDRSLEERAGVGEISLQNIHQARVLLPDGRLGRANWADVEGAANSALRNAEWNIEPEGIPESLRQAWLAVEFNDLASAAAAIKKATSSRNADEKAAAKKLLAYVSRQIETDVAAAKQAADNGQLWDAYKRYTALADRFDGYDLPEIRATIRQLAGEAAVKNELTAGKMYEAAAKLVLNPRTRGRATFRLATIVEQHGETEAGAKAKELLEKLTSP